MSWWFGRKSAPEGRGLLPAFLQSGETGGFARGVEGMRLTERASGMELAYRSGAWTSGSARVSEVLVGGLKVVGARGAAIPDATGGTTVDTQARLALGQVLAALRTHGLIAT